jgi:anti-sigma-K factor RskA
VGRELTPEEVRELLGAYALGAVDPEEAAAIERHLLTDPEARAEVHVLQSGAAWLERSAERPAPRVWDAIAGDIEGELGTATPQDADRRSVATLAARRRLTRRAALAIAATIAAVAIVAGGARAFLDDDRAVSDRALDAAAASVASAPGARTVALTTTAGRDALDVVLLPDGSGVVTDVALPSLGTTRTYQLWAITPEGPQSVGLLGAAPGVTAVRVPASASTMAVTAEPRGGSPQPTGRVLAQAAVEA